MQSLEWYKMNALLQQKKNKLRSALKTKGVLKKEGANNFDRYKYFSEAQYKELFTELFSTCGLELKADTLEYEAYGGSDKQPNGRKVTVEFSLIDVETGFYESSRIIGEGVDKGDKAGYKAYTGALKYFFAETFNVATGDDPEKESPETNAKPQSVTNEMVRDFQLGYSDEERRRIRANYQVRTDSQIPFNAMKKYIEDRQGIISQKRPKGSDIFDDPLPFN